MASVYKIRHRQTGFYVGSGGTKREGKLKFLQTGEVDLKDILPWHKLGGNFYATYKQAAARAHVLSQQLKRHNLPTDLEIVEFEIKEVTATPYF